ncbi:hypothetical protein CKO28_00340 [Rhodovibrio sodomensis]|uniref:Clp R domain-containing protein n=1 Tax=Rhodovibrio sodomensis TaxID=1088 RepID=A0ABS1D9S5_9PROT|nr:AAA family ATPase [Rhodovibrio sodomensis]MBK1666488.1 hypothetical protein [Rhodovibrio sodomensis]
MSLNQEASQTVQQAERLAIDKDHETITLEHLLLALLTTQSARELIELAGADVEQMSDEVMDYLDRELPVSQVTVESRMVMPSEPYQRVMEYANMAVEGLGLQEIDPCSLLLALFHEKQSHAVYILQNHDLSQQTLLAGFQKMRARNGVARQVVSSRGQTTAPAGGEPEDDTKATGSALESYCIDLSRRAAEGRIDPAIGREVEIARALRILSRRTKNNPVLVGDPGVGKTAIAEGLALKLAGDTQVYALDLTAMLAGTRFRGDFESRMKSVITEISQQPNAILFIDEIHTLIGAGSANHGSLDAANILKPALARGELRCLGATTHTEYRKYFEKDAAMSRRFQPVSVDEPSEEDALAILRGLESRYAGHHKVSYSPQALEAAVKLSAKHIRQRRLPDKAIDLIDEAGARARLAGETEIDKADIEALVSEVARIETASTSSDERNRLEQLPARLSEAVFDQVPAITTVTDAVHTARAGLRDHEKPIGSYLFAGPTGVGKTELARQLALSLEIPLVRFDMSEYMEAHSVSRLIGAPPGYIGYDNGGLLTTAVSEKPDCLLLLDEIEKAHPSLFNALLQVMDYGTLTDGTGRVVDFRNVMLIMTTNAGVVAQDTAPMGLVPRDPQAEAEEAADRELEALFSPEFRNRLDEIVRFGPITRATTERIVDKLIAGLESQLSDREIRLTASDAARTRLADLGYDSAKGARPLGRVFERQVKRPLSKLLLFGDLPAGSLVEIRVEGDEIVVQPEAVRTPAAKTRQDEAVPA